MKLIIKSNNYKMEMSTYFYWKNITICDKEWNVHMIYMFFKAKYKWQIYQVSESNACF